MRLAVPLFSVLVAASVLACDKGGETTTPTPDTTQTADETPSEAADPSLTGILDEDAFMALHELSDEAAPEPRGQTIHIAGTDAYLSLPEDASTPLPGIVVVHEWWGLNDHIRHWSDRLAEDGYAAIAVDLYGGKTATTPEEAMMLMKAVDQDVAAAILSAAHDYLDQAPEIDAEEQAVVGWCFGGGWALRHAIATPDLDAAVIYYGHPELDPEILSRIEAPLLGVFGNQDESIPPEAVDAFEQALDEAGKSIEIHRYDAVHAFANPSSANYNHEAAADAWNHVRAFLAEHLQAEASDDAAPAADTAPAADAPASQ